ncbi:hypothetical protein FOA52_008714 [Chlamydomonas sp. UWO 241]|nr:hypothetical protein FOA52_008714 [Chlamydomonas sp. UWO 241]
MWEREAEWAATHCAVTFIAAALTDWLDGYLARKLKCASVFGAFLDPVADKVMVTVTLILLTVSPPTPITDKIMVLPVAMMICREITMSALREWAAAAGGAAHKAVKVNSLGKWKTAFQMVSMSLLLLLRQPLSSWVQLLSAYVPGTYTSAAAVHTNLVWVSYVMLWAATGMAVWSLSTYMSNVWTHFIYPEQKPKAP